MLSKILYHGTKYQYKDNILNNGFTYRERKNHWLGQGIYFFEDKDQALCWDTKGIRKVIFEVEIEVPLVEVLDLDSISGMTFFKKEVNSILTNSDIMLEFKEEDEHTNRCFFLDIVKTINPNISLIKFTFQLKDPKYDKRELKQIQDKIPLGLTINQLQYCLHKNEYIKNKRIVFTEPEAIRTIFPRRKTF